MLAQKVKTVSRGRISNITLRNYSQLKMTKSACRKEANSLSERLALTKIDNNKTIMSLRDCPDKIHRDISRMMQ